MYTILRELADALRQKLLLEQAYPLLAERSALWGFLPAGHPEHLSPEGRYILFAYRAATDASERCREWLAERDFIPWAAAVEAEARFLSMRECAALPPGWAPPIPEFVPSVTTLAVA